MFISSENGDFLRKVMLVIIFTADDEVIQDVKWNTLFELGMGIKSYRCNPKKTVYQINLIQNY